MVFADALALFQEQQKISTEIKERSKEYNQRCADANLKTWKGLETLDIKRITKQDCLRWRAESGNRYGATTTNGTLSILRRARISRQRLWLAQTTIFASWVHGFGLISFSFATVALISAHEGACQRFRTPSRPQS